MLRIIGDCHGKIDKYNKIAKQVESSVQIGLCLVIVILHEQKIKDLLRLG